MTINKLACKEIMINKIKEMVENGFACQKIGKIINMPVEEVREIVKLNKFILIKENFSEDKINYIINLYKDGVSAKNLGIKYHIGKDKIQKWVKDCGELRDKGVANRLYLFNENIFDFIDSQEKAYWLGFLYADAYNYEKKGWLNISLKIDDIDHLRKFSEFIGLSDNIIKERQANLNGKFYGVCSLHINSKYLSNKLKDLGCPQAKSFIITYPNWLNKNLQFHFIRGYFDGDGCLTFRQKQKEWKWSLVGTKELCESLVTIFKENDLNIKYHNISKTNNNTYELESAGNLKIRKICDLLYKDSNIFLERKFQKYIKLKEQNLANHPDKFVSHNYHELFNINGNVLNTEYIKSIDLNSKLNLVEDITNYINSVGFIYPNDNSTLLKEFEQLKEKNIDINLFEVNNNSRVCTSICKYFCHSFYNSRTRDGESIFDSYNKKENIRSVVRNKLGLNTNFMPDSFNFNHQTIINELRSMRLSGHVSIFKPLIAKYMCLKYSEINDTVYDYSCGFGGRLLGAMSCDRKYIGTDPLTVPELKEMISFFNFENCELIQSGSENYKGKENSIDLSWSSPPFYNIEVYSDSLNQAYNKGEEYFYNKYWVKTLENIKYMLKPNKWFGINIDKNHYKMIDIAKKYFGDVLEEVKLKSIRYHFAGEKIKYESIYMFRNIK